VRGAPDHDEDQTRGASPRTDAPEARGDGASIAEISRAVRITKGSLYYYYFRNKEEILYSCHDHSPNILLDLLDDVEEIGQVFADYVLAGLRA
jgi:AcrR family transcriptional regulator